VGLKAFESVEIDKALSLQPETQTPSPNFVFDDTIPGTRQAPVPSAEARLTLHLSLSAKEPYRSETAYKRPTKSYRAIVEHFLLLFFEAALVHRSRIHDHSMKQLPE